MAFQDADGNWWNLDLSADRIVSEWFGTGAGGGSDDTAALRLASAALTPGKQLWLSAQNYGVTGTITAPKGVSIEGSWAETCAITVLGSADFQNGIFCTGNNGDVKIKGVSLIGNGVSTIPSAVGAVYAILDGTNSQAAGPVVVEECVLRNFKHDYWIRMVNDSGYSFELLEVTRCKFYSVFGNSRSYDGSIPNGAFIDAWGNTSVVGGSITKVVARDNYMEGIGVLGGIKMWANVRGWNIDNNDILHCADNATAIMNTYDVLAYTASDDSNFLNGGGRFTNNRITHNYGAPGYIGPGCGFYGAHTGPIIATGNSVTGITRTDNTTLRRAAYTFGGCAQLTCVGNAAIGCATGFAFSGAADQINVAGKSNHLFAANTVTSEAGSANAFNISWIDAGTVPVNVALIGNAVAVSGAITVLNRGTYGTFYQSP